jgi:glycine/sarcosine N-methyltransferase
MSTARPEIAWGRWFRYAPSREANVPDVDPYRDFAVRYDAFPRDALGRTAFFAKLFEEHAVRRVLDCACGTGDDLLLFHALGLDVAGSDRSEAMLSQARAKLSAGGVDVPLIRSDFRDLPGRFDRPFGAVVCLSTSLPHLHEDVEILEALGSMRGVLHDGGLLVLDQGMTDRQWAERPRFLPAVNTAELCRLMAIDYGDETFAVHVIDFTGGGGERAFYHDTFVYRRLLRDDYERLLRRSGFCELVFYAGYDGSPYDRGESRRLICVAVK